MSSTMTVTHVQPRRRAPPTPSEPCVDLDSLKELSIRKGATFQQTKSPSSPLDDPVIDFKNLPSRSLTCPKALEDLQEQSDKLVSDIVNSFDRSLSGLGVAGAKDTIAQRMQENTKQGSQADTNHTGMSTMPTTSITTNLANTTPQAYKSVYKPVNGKPTSTSNHVLSDFAAKVIKLHIIDPILEEESLKDFHPIVRGIPQRIGSKQIRCLRDLEKVFIFLAPVSIDLYKGEGVLAHCFIRAKNTAKSPRSYLDFCETSIQCIHTTVDHLNETDQRRANDRPYTNNYFVDLVEQVRQYARIMAVSRAKKEKGIALDDSDIQPLVPQVTNDSEGNALLTLISGEKVLLRGGVAEDGGPIQLVREVDGKFVPIPADHMDLDDIMDDDVARSMARKRKCDIGKVEYRACRECGKVYTRPCDLTKHEKTHTRPWKCSDESCKYFEFGWPTEKERDRHMNDKHSSAPALYHCLWKDEGCTYTSKRESNCKQHMEKAHNWDYVRSKSKKGTKLMPSAASPTQSLMPTPMSDRLPTPALTASSNESPAPSIYDAFSPAAESSNAAYTRDGSMSSYRPSTGAPSPAGSEPVFSFNDYSKGFSYDGFLSPNVSEFAQTPVTYDNNFQAGDGVISTFEHDFNFNKVNNDWGAMGNIFTGYNIPQQHTPAPDSLYDFGSVDNSAASIAQFSPGASSAAMLFGDNNALMQESQNYIDFAAQAKAGQQQPATMAPSSSADYALFGEVMDTTDVSSMFPDLVDMPINDTEMSGSMFDQMTEDEMERYLYSL